MAYTRDDAYDTHKDYKENVIFGNIILDHTMAVMIIRLVNILIDTI